MIPVTLGRLNRVWGHKSGVGNGGGSLYEAEGREIYIFGVLRLRGGKPIYFWGVGAEGRETQFVGVVNLRETNPTYCLGIEARGV